MKIRTIAYLIIYLFAFTKVLALADQSAQTLLQPVISGKVTGPTRNPIARAKVKLLSANETLDCQAITNSLGEFAMPHRPCETCCLEVVPPKDSGLSPAWIDKIPGEATRTIVVSLRPGFEIKGRVIHDGRALKDIIIAISPLDEDNHHHGFVHGGGWSRTNNNGVFEVTLPPGLKRLEITNKRYTDLQSHLESRIVVTEDGTIPDIELPARPSEEASTQ